MGAVVVRAAGTEDAEFIIACQCGLGLESEGVSLDGALLSRGVRAVLADASKGRYLVAERDGHPLGVLLTQTEWSDWRCGTVLWIHSVYVLPAARAQGVFRALYESLRGEVERSPELLGLRLYTNCTNQVAHAVYEALGMDGAHNRMYEWLKAEGDGTI